MDKKLYVTTGSAGFVVAGRRIPAVYVTGKEPAPQVGYELKLSDDEAAYELAQGAIALKKPAMKDASKGAERPGE